MSRDFGFMNFAPRQISFETCSTYTPRVEEGVRQSPGSEKFSHKFCQVRPVFNTFHLVSNFCIYIDITSFTDTLPYTINSTIVEWNIISMLKVFGGHISGAGNSGIRSEV